MDSSSLFLSYNRTAPFFSLFLCAYGLRPAYDPFAVNTLVPLFKRFAIANRSPFPLAPFVSDLSDSLTLLPGVKQVSYKSIRDKETYRHTILISVKMALLIRTT
jgi:hypothetical protein